MVHIYIYLDASHKITLSLIPLLVLGNFVYVNVMGMPVFVIDDHKVAEQLPNVRGRMNASRPPIVLALGLCVVLLNRTLVSNKFCLERVEFVIDPAGKDTLRGTFAYAQSYISRCHWVALSAD